MNRRIVVAVLALALALPGLASAQGEQGPITRIAKFLAYDGAMSEEEKAERQQAAEALFQPGSHYDQVLRQVVFSASTEARPGVFYVGDYTAKPGRGMELTQLYREVAASVAEKMQADGVITSYGLAVSELHGDPGTHSDVVLVIFHYGGSSEE